MFRNDPTYRVFARLNVTTGKKLNDPIIDNDEFIAVCVNDIQAVISDGDKTLLLMVSREGAISLPARAADVLFAIQSQLEQ